VTAALVSAVLDGRYPPGTRLPPERDLAEELDTSRVSVRSAIGRLVEWGVVSSRQGSGITVRPRRRWTAGVLASVVERALARGKFDELVPLFADARSLRRWVVLDMLERAADHFAASPPALGEHPLDPVRAIVDEAWEHRHDTEAFVAIDRDTLPGILEAAGMLPSLLLVNSLAAPYLAVMRAVPAASPVLASYRESQHEVLDAVERGDGREARKLMTDYLGELDERVLGFLPEHVRRAIG
jgi:DNA-binding FadR family transcriptional regulator